MSLNIANFFNPDDVREYLRAPFHLDGKTIASNGHVMLIMPEHGNYQPCPENFIETTRKVIRSLDSVKFQPLPDNIQFPEQVVCKACEGTGKSKKHNCPECDGEGEVEFDNDYHRYWCDCKTCNGDGEIIKKGGDNDCTRCHGTGKICLDKATLVLDDLYVDANYLKLIVDESGIEIGVGNAQETIHALYFRTGEAHGLIMRMYT